MRYIGWGMVTLLWLGLGVVCFYLARLVRVDYQEWRKSREADS